MATQRGLPLVAVSCLFAAVQGCHFSFLSVGEAFPLNNPLATALQDQADFILRLGGKGPQVVQLGGLEEELKPVPSSPSLQRELAPGHLLKLFLINTTAALIEPKGLSSDWLRESAAAAPGDWLIAAGQHPADDMASIGSFLSGFDLYVNGHQTMLQQYEFAGSPAHVTVTAAEGRGVQNQDGSSGSQLHGSATQMKTIWSSQRAGFARHCFEKDLGTLTTDLFDFDLNKLHSFTVHRKLRMQNVTETTCSGPKTFPCTPGCTYVHKANEDKCSVPVYGCYDCNSLPKTCPDCHASVEAFV